MADIPSGPWWVVAAASAPSVAGGVWIAWKWLVERHDKADEAELSMEERRMLHMEQERQSLSAGQQSLFDNVRKENERISKELGETRADRDRGWAFARRCEARMHDLFHKLWNTRQMVDSARELAKQPPAVWPAEAPLPTDHEISA